MQNLNAYYEFFQRIHVNEKFKLVLIDKKLYLKMPYKYEFECIQIRQIELNKRNAIQNNNAYPLRISTMRDNATRRNHFDPIQYYTLQPYRFLFGNLNPYRCRIPLKISKLDIKLAYRNNLKKHFNLFYSKLKIFKNRFYRKLKQAKSKTSLNYESKNYFDLSSKLANLNSIKTDNKHYNLMKNNQYKTNNLKEFETNSLDKRKKGTNLTNFELVGINILNKDLSNTDKRDFSAERNQFYGKPREKINYHETSQTNKLKEFQFSEGKSKNDNQKINLNDIIPSYYLKREINKLKSSPSTNDFKKKEYNEQDFSVLKDNAEEFQIKNSYSKNNIENKEINSLQNDKRDLIDLNIQSNSLIYLINKSKNNSDPSLRQNETKQYTNLNTTEMNLSITNSIIKQHSKIQLPKLIKEGDKRGKITNSDSKLESFSLLAKSNKKFSSSSLPSLSQLKQCSNNLKLNFLKKSDDETNKKIISIKDLKANNESNTMTSNESLKKPSSKNSNDKSYGCFHVNSFPLLENISAKSKSLIVSNNSSGLKLNTSVSNSYKKAQDTSSSSIVKLSNENSKLLDKTDLSYHRKESISESKSSYEVVVKTVQAKESVSSLISLNSQNKLSRKKSIELFQLRSPISKISSRDELDNSESQTSKHVPSQCTRKTTLISRENSINDSLQNIDRNSKISEKNSKNEKLDEEDILLSKKNHLETESNKYRLSSYSLKNSTKSNENIKVKDLNLNDENDKETKINSEKQDKKIAQNLKANLTRIKKSEGFGEKTITNKNKLRKLNNNNKTKSKVSKEKRNLIKTKSETSRLTTTKSISSSIKTDNKSIIDLNLSKTTLINENNSLHEKLTYDTSLHSKLTNGSIARENSKETSNEINKPRRQLSPITILENQITQNNNFNLINESLNETSSNKSEITEPNKEATTQSVPISNEKPFCDLKYLPNSLLRDRLISELSFTSPYKFSYYDLPSSNAQFNQEYTRLKEYGHILKNIKLDGKFKKSSLSKYEISKSNEIVDKVFTDLDKLKSNQISSDRLKIKANQGYHLNNHIGSILKHIDKYGEDFDYGAFYTDKKISANYLNLGSTKFPIL